MMKKKTPGFWLNRLCMRDNTKGFVKRRKLKELRNLGIGGLILWYWIVLITTGGLQIRWYKIQRNNLGVLRIFIFMREEWMFGFTGRLLHIDLTTTVRSTKKLDETVARHYLGGGGLGAQILSSMNWEVDPLGPENRGKPKFSYLLWWRKRRLVSD